jgi:hypothetical protein
MRFAMSFVTALAALLFPWGPRASTPEEDPWEEAAAEAAADVAMAGDLATAVDRAEAQMYVVGTGAEEEALPVFGPAGERLVARMAEGFLTAIRRESPKWWGCGVETPKEEQLARADRIARGILDGQREWDLRWLSPWAVIATVWSESRGDPCAIGPNSRKAARDLGLVPEDRIFNRWSADDVKALLENPKWKKSRAKIGADIGLGQEVWQRYARILDPNGDLRCGRKDLACRVPTLDEVLSYKNGPRVVITGMVHRRWMYRNTQPWMHWPGSIRSLSYGMKIARLVQSMGGDVSERPVW